ncbi:MAG: RlmE family RNA methyltransferase [Pseudomonadales bacterium]
MVKKSKSSRQWLQNHQEDEYVRRARKDGYRSRASYKLLEINEKFNLIGPGARIVDLGAAPGGWSQVAVRLAGKQAMVIAVDMLPMDALDGVRFIQGDFEKDETYEELMLQTAGQPVDLVISDMAPNLSGMKDVDQPRSAWLVELAVEYADRVLRPGGALVAKCFEGEGIEALRGAFRCRFDRMSNFKPRASRQKSREIYLIGRGYEGRRS